MRAFISSLFLLTFLWSCDNKPKELSILEYSKGVFVEDFHLVKGKTVKNIDLSVRYLPTNYLVIQDAGEYIDQKTYDSVFALYENSFTFEIEVADKNNIYPYLVPAQGDYATLDQINRILYFNNQEFFEMQMGESSLLPELVQFNDFGKMTNKASFMVVFNRKEMKKLLMDDDFRILFKDQFLGIGEHRFLFKQSDINSLPSLKL